MFLNETHQNNFKTLEERFTKPNSRINKAVNLIFSIPSIYNAFESSFAEGVYQPIDMAVLYLDELDKNLSGYRFSKGEISMLQLAVELWNGTSHLEKGTFKLHDAFNHWDDDYVALFYSVLQTVRPTVANQQ